MKKKNIVANYKYLFKNLFFPAIIFFILLLFYTSTLLPTVSFWDTAELQTIAYTLDIGHPTGYPTYILIGKIFIHLFPFFSIAWRMNFFSALLVSLSALLSYSIINRLSKNNLFSFLATLIFYLSKPVWDIAVKAEVHSLHLFFTSLFLFLLIFLINSKKIKYLPLITFISAISLGNHLLSIFFLPLLLFTFIYIILKRKQFNLQNNANLFVFSFISFLVGLSIYLTLPLIALKKPPFTIDYNLATKEGFFRHVVGKDFNHLMKNWAKKTFSLSFLYYLNLFKAYLPLYSLVLIFLGLIVAVKQNPIINILLIMLFTSTVGFSLRYQNAALERYFITSFLILTIWLVIGLESIISFFRKLLKKIIKKENFIKITNILINIIVILLLNYFLLNKTISNYRVVDQSQDYSGLIYAQTAFNNTDSNGVIISWWSYSTPLWYLQKVEGVRKDIKIYNLSHYQWEEKVMQNIDKYPVYLIEEFEFKNPHLVLEPKGNLYRVLKSEEKLN